uniref:Uncharacterized protein n=1 Tax=Populus trichocarpa TaxID=3694 RepID=A0A3N7FX15_POPTR
MSPFDHKLLDIRMAGVSSETLELSIEEGWFYHFCFTYCFQELQFKFLVFGILPQQYHGDGDHPCNTVVLFQGMELLPTCQKSSLAIFMYSFLVCIDFLISRSVFYSPSKEGSFLFYDRCC